MTKINEIYVELSENSQRYVNECCESESDGESNGFGVGCCKCRGGVAVAMWYCMIKVVAMGGITGFRFSRSPNPGCIVHGFVCISRTGRLGVVS
jgi:hypothetical protein